MTTKEQVIQADQRRLSFDCEEERFRIIADYVLTARQYLLERGWSCIESWPWTWVRAVNWDGCDLAEALRITMEEEDDPDDEDLPA